MSDKKPIESGDVLPGVLQALPGIELRDFFAAMWMHAQSQTGALHAMIGVVTGRGSILEYEKSLNEFADDAPRAGYAMADAMLVARGATAAEAERQKRLAAIGQGAVDLAEDLMLECAMCSGGGVNGAEHDAECPVGDYIRDFPPSTRDTEPAPSSEPVGLAVSVPEKPKDWDPFTTNVEGDMPGPHGPIPDAPNVCGHPDTPDEFCELPRGHTGDHGRGSRVPAGPLVGKARGEGSE